MKSVDRRWKGAPDEEIGTTMNYKQKVGDRDKGDAKTKIN